MRKTHIPFLLWVVGFTVVGLFAEALPAQSLDFDLGRIQSYRQITDQYGRTVKEIFTLPSGVAVTVSYFWEGGTNRCQSAEARMDGLLIGSAKVVDVKGDQSTGYYQEVEETHYAKNGSGKVIYRATSNFPISFGSVKRGEKKLEGKKLYELFSRWGTVR